MDYDPVSALTDVMRVLASTPADFAALCLEVFFIFILLLSFLFLFIFYYIFSFLKHESPCFNSCLLCRSLVMYACITLIDLKVEILHSKLN